MKAQKMKFSASLDAPINEEHRVFLDRVFLDRVLLEGAGVVQGLMNGHFEMDQEDARNLADDIAIIMKDLGIRSERTLSACQFNFWLLCWETPRLPLMMPTTAVYFDCFERKLPPCSSAVVPEIKLLPENQAVG